MTAPISIFVEHPSESPRFVRLVEETLRVEFRRVADDAGSRYVHHGVGYSMVMSTDHGLEDDLGIPFASFKHEIDIDVIPIRNDPECTAEFKHWLALYLHGRLRSALSCPMMVVYNLQHVLLTSQ